MNEDNIYYEFKDLPDKTTPLKSETLNAIQSSIKDDIKSLNNKITNINNNIDGISDMVISINRTKADANSVYTKKESDNKYANAIKQELIKVKEAQINSTGANLQNVEFFGESMQKSREGYNYFNTKRNVGTSTNTQVTIIDNNNIKAATTQEEKWKSTGFLIDNLEPNTDYFLKANIENSNSLITNNYCVISNYTTGAQLKAGYELETGITFNTGVLEEGQSIQIAFSVTSATAAINTAIFSNIFLVKNVDKEKEYEDFGAMPSIDYPSPISSITNIDYKATGKNIFDGEMELGSINWQNGEFEDNTNCIRSKNYTEVVEGQYYAFSNNRNYTHNVYCYDKNKQFISAEAVANNTSYQIPANIKYIRFRTTQGNVENNLDTDFQIEKGSTVTAFEAYKKKTSAIILPEGVELCGTSDVQDKIDYTGLIHKKLKKVLLTGTENWNIFKYGTAHVNTTMFNVTIADLINKDNSVKMCSTLEIKKNTTETLNSDTEWIMCNSAKGVFISINNNRLESLDETGLKKFLISNNIEILIEIEEDTTQSLAEAEKAKLKNLETFEGINNITSNAPISAVYNIDTKSYIDSKFNTLAQQLLNIVGGN